MSPNVETGRRLVYMFAERVREILPTSEFQVKTNGRTIKVTGVGGNRGNMYSTAPILLWLLPRSTRRRLELIAETQGRALQRFLSNRQNQVWPAPGADLHVQVDAEFVKVWWGGTDEDSAVTHLRPLSLMELGIELQDR